MKDEEDMNISRKPLNVYDLEANDQVTNEINNVRSSGSASLDSSTKEFMESRFGYDFSNVRIYADERAARSAQSVNAIAYTAGNDIVFGQGQYQPYTLEGRRLLAHELTHVIQQTTKTKSSSHVQRAPDEKPKAPEEKQKRWDVVILGEGVEAGEELALILTARARIIPVKSLGEAAAKLKGSISPSTLCTS
jgi:Domain of unknown function (DUF4157)